jgi:hypothetical protein
LRLRAHALIRPVEGKFGTCTESSIHQAVSPEFGHPSVRVPEELIAGVNGENHHDEWETGTTESKEIG